MASHERLHPVAANGHQEMTTTGLDHRKVLMWAFLASDCLFFGSLISTYLVYQGRSTVGPTPEEIFSIPITSISTFVLLTSSLAMVLALAAIQRNDIKGLRLWLFMVVLMGATFLSFQGYEFLTFRHEGLTPTTSVFGSTFFTLTGFHGAHVSVGVAWLLGLLLYSFKGGLKRENSLQVELAGLYWHFVDIVWIIIFTVVYLVGTS
jgi:heme/copper-type cytochrome/quinol oxidase subunit 3